MTCIDAKFDTAQFDVSKFDTLCGVTGYEDGTDTTPMMTEMGRDGYLLIPR